MSSPVSSSTALQPDTEMTMPATIKPLHDFVKLSSNISIYTPRSSSSSTTAGDKSSSQAPTTILFCSWLNAQPRHIAKFTAHYQIIYPKSRIILVKINTHQFLFESEQKRKRDMEPVVSALLSESSSGAEDRLLVHVCSSGGAKRLYNILGAYHSKAKTFLPAKSVIYDSSPGIPHFASGLRALLVAGSKMSWPVYIPFYLSMFLLQAYIVFAVHYTPLMKDLVWNPRDGCNDKRLLSEKAVRGYIYSEDDQVVEARDIVKHAEDAVERGLLVRSCRLTGAEHVKLFVGGKEKEDVYWGFVDEIWRCAVDAV